MYAPGERDDPTPLFLRGEELEDEDFLSCVVSTLKVGTLSRQYRKNRGLSTPFGPAFTARLLRSKKCVGAEKGFC